jgi:predicted O-methyltransferase YrrM
VQDAQRAARIALERDPEAYQFLRRLLETNGVTDETVIQNILGRAGMTLVAWDDDLNQGYATPYVEPRDD